MLKKFLFVMIAVFLTPCAFAQEVFWGYDEENRELIVPTECDGSQDTDELYETGMRLYEETGYARRGASYCLLAAAMDNHPKAQYQVAHMYHKGILLPKSDLAAYKWATLAALNGSAEGDKLGANIEQFLSIQDIEASTKSLEALLPIITKNTQQKLADEKNKQQIIKQTIKSVDAEVRDLKKYGYIRSSTKTANERKMEKLKAQQAGLEDTVNAKAENTNKKPTQTVARPAAYKETAGGAKERAKPNEPIYSQKDLDDTPLPSAI